MSPYRVSVIYVFTQQVSQIFYEVFDRKSARTMFNTLSIPESLATRIHITLERKKWFSDGYKEIARRTVKW